MCGCIKKNSNSSNNNKKTSTSITRINSGGKQLTKEELLAKINRKKTTN